MAIYPCRQDLRSVSNEPEIVPWMFIAHVAVNGSTPGIQSGPGFHDGLDWHFYIDKGPGSPEGIITQLRDTKWQADASYKANGFYVNGRYCGALSFESEGTGDDAWTDDQCTAIIWLFQKAHDIDGIPLEVCPAWNSPGLGYHRLFNEWNSPYHSCPGDQKVWQFYNVIIPALGRPIEPEVKDDDMPYYLFCPDSGANARWWFTNLLTDSRPCDSIDDALNVDYFLRGIAKKDGLICNRDGSGAVAGPISVDKAWLDMVTSQTASD